MSITATADPPFGHLARQANKLMEQVQKGYFNFCPSDTWTPSVNLYENATAYVVCVDLAGVEKEKIDVEVVDNRLRLRGTRPVPTFDEEPAVASAGSAVGADVQPRRLRVHLMEIDHGSFSREVELPHGVNRQEITATYRNGMLWIEIPKT